MARCKSAACRYRAIWSLVALAAAFAASEADLAPWASMIAQLRPPNETMIPATVATSPHVTDQNGIIRRNHIPSRRRSQCGEIVESMTFRYDRVQLSLKTAAEPTGAVQLLGVEAQAAPALGLLGRRPRHPKRLNALNKQMFLELNSTLDFDWAARGALVTRVRRARSSGAGCRCACRRRGDLRRDVVSFYHRSYISYRGEVWRSSPGTKQRGSRRCSPLQRPPADAFGLT